MRRDTCTKETRILDILKEQTIDVLIAFMKTGHLQSSASLNSASFVELLFFGKRHFLPHLSSEVGSVVVDVHDPNRERHGCALWWNASITAQHSDAKVRRHLAIHTAEGQHLVHVGQRNVHFLQAITHIAVRLVRSL